MKFLVFAASHRIDSYNRKLVAHTSKYLTGKGIQVDCADYADFDMPIYNGGIELPESAYSFAKRAAGVNGIIISSPEYNWSYPGSLKNIIDWTSCIAPKPLEGKTVLLMCASTGSRGGILGLSHLKTPMEASQMYVFPKVFPLGNCQQLFDSADVLASKPSQHLNTMLDDYVTFTRKLTNPKL